MEWNIESIMEFLVLYEGDPIIRNPQNQHHKDRNHVYDAWKRIQSRLTIDLSLKVLKKKKEYLMATYRKASNKSQKQCKNRSWSLRTISPGFLAAFFIGMKEVIPLSSFLHNPGMTLPSTSVSNVPGGVYDDGLLLMKLFKRTHVNVTLLARTRDFDESPRFRPP
ncbi:hypothetical protein AVEN_41181-1 [Araneus ventricosus]|uniref:MADF domain-containing protein n=1 Tax=Araneus ventricosus TaxID=182803 RepID=A0A4Y2SJR6_ARAVE|nr:hypothetical protein AVEN_41181-1 [Araneus ventricosus]